MQYYCSLKFNRALKSHLNVKVTECKFNVESTGYVEFLKYNTIKAGLNIFPSFPVWRYTSVMLKVLRISAYTCLYYAYKMKNCSRYTFFISLASLECSYTYTM